MCVCVSANIMWPANKDSSEYKDYYEYIIYILTLCYLYHVTNYVFVNRHWPAQSINTSWRILHPNIIEVTVTWAGEASSILQTIHVSLCLRWTESLNDCLSLSHLSQPVWLQLTFHQHRKDHRFCKLDVGVIAFWLRSAPCQYSARRAGGLACFC